VILENRLCRDSPPQSALPSQDGEPGGYLSGCRSANNFGDIAASLSFSDAQRRLPHHALRFGSERFIARGAYRNDNRLHTVGSGPATAVVAGNVPAPVRVRLKRVSCDHAIPYPPDGQAREWWQRLKNAFGTTSSAFVNASLQQLIAAARLPKSGISEPAVNASLAFIEGAKPEGEVECALVIQMACTHTAAMAVLQRLGGGHGGDRSVAAMATAAARLLRAYATQVETLRRLKNGGSQVVRVEPVHVNEGGQALIGNVRKDGGGKDPSPTTWTVHRNQRATAEAIAPKNLRADAGSESPRKKALIPSRVCSNPLCTFHDV
jgi:hypothetical protein